MNIYKADKERVVVFDRRKREQKILFETMISLKEFVVLGIEHILIGYDHLLFLLMLLLPVTLRELRFWDIFKVVTAFTLSHSLTLLLSALNIVTPPAQLIEGLIGVTIVLTALNNLVKRISFKKEWLLAFLFGFIHGFGFANALKEMDLERVNLIKMVFGFNLGVEVGQLLVLLFCFPFLFFLLKRYASLYKVLNYVGLGLGVIWIVKRWQIL